VALSFAGEQRGYVEAVASLLTREGLRVFYDQFYQSQIWGKSLPEYLQEVYYRQSRWCIMFISKEYVEKMYPVHERKSAIAREVKDLGGYILPVRFDSTEVPGLDPGLAYQDANKKSPEEIASLFLQKFSENNSNKSSE
jgi:hypothetical protein